MSYFFMYLGCTRDSRVQARRECEESLMHFVQMARDVIKPLAGATIKSYEA
jgi:hypothetical protein